MANQNTLSMVGTVAEIDDTNRDGSKRKTNAGSEWIRVKVVGVDNNTKWMSAFDESHISAIRQVANGNDEVSIRYTESQGANGRTNTNVKGVSFNKERQVTPKSPPPSPVASKAVLPTDNWASNLTERDRSIIRQVAFKDVANKDDKPPSEISDLTDIYEQIILGTFSLDLDDPIAGLDDSAFINNPDETVQDF